MEYITMDSFGSECPANWQEIADYLNVRIDALEGIADDDGEITAEGREQIDRIWESYWNAYHSGTLPEGAPVPADPTITECDTGIVMKCQAAGCSAEEILNSLGIDAHELFS